MSESSSPLNSSDELPCLHISQRILSSVRLTRQLSFPVPQCTFCWDDLKVSYRTPSGPQTILHACSGSVSGGEMMAIMGPSGAGKSTLLDTLTMRKTSGDISGRVLLNDRLRSENFFIQSAYVPQEDNLVPTNTVRETMEFYAALTLPARRQAERQNRRQAVDERLCSVGLLDKQHRRVGGRLPGGFSVRGLSGGEKRRLSIAAGVVHSPPLVFLDECTSGLDAFSALCVMESLRAMTKLGHAVICTIHQPRQAILDMFSKVAFLSAGRLVYLGPPSGVQAWLVKASLWDPVRAATESLSDMVLDCITVGFEKPEELYGSHTLHDVSDLERLAMSHRNVSSESTESGIGVDASRVLQRARWRPGAFRQYCTLQEQQLRIAFRSPGTIAARMGLHLLIGLLIGAVYYDMDDHFLVEPGGWSRWLPLQPRLSSMPQDRIGVLFLLVLAQTVTPNCAMSFFIEDRQYYSRESTSRLYGAVPYHVANAVTEALVCLVNSSLASLVATSMAGLPLSGRWHLTMAVLVSNHMCASAMVQMCARMAPNQDIAFVFSAGYIILCLLFANVLVKVNTVAPMLASIRWVCSLYYPMAALVSSEFATVEEQGYPVGDLVAASFRIDLAGGGALSETACLGVIWIFYSVFSVASLFGLKFMSKQNI